MPGDGSRLQQVPPVPASAPPQLPATAHSSGAASTRPPPASKGPEPGPPLCQHSPGLWPPACHPCVAAPPPPRAGRPPPWRRRRPCPGARAGRPRCRQRAARGRRSVERQAICGAEQLQRRSLARVSCKPAARGAQAPHRWVRSVTVRRRESSSRRSASRSLERACGAHAGGQGQGISRKDVSAALGSGTHAPPCERGRGSLTPSSACISSQRPSGASTSNSSLRPASCRGRRGGQQRWAGQP